MANQKRAINNKSILSNRKSFSYLQIIIFVFLFSAMGVYAVLQSSASPLSSVSATLSMSPNPVTSGQRYAISGCGYENKPVHLVYSDGTQFGTGVWADGGCIKGYANAGPAGTYTVEAYQDGKGKKRILKSTATLNVTP